MLEKLKNLLKKYGAAETARQLARFAFYTAEMYRGPGGREREELDGYFTNGVNDIFDAVPNNVLMGDDGHLYFIDTIIFRSGTGGQETYQSLSPRASK